VVVTGLGPVSAIGTGTEAFWKNLVDGQTGIDRISSFDPSPFTCQVCGLIMAVLVLGRWSDSETGPSYGARMTV
jgi:3-oxoacyl-(acyl-carrier-protein) synthase